MTIAIVIAVVTVIAISVSLLRRVKVSGAIFAEGFAAFVLFVAIIFVVCAVGYGVFLGGKELWAESKWERVPSDKQSDACLRATERHRILSAQYKVVNAEALRTKDLDKLEAADDLKTRRDDADNDEYDYCYSYGGD